VKEHGKVILDFGAGHLYETKILRSIGMQVTPFEPYRVDASEEISKQESISLTREFLYDISHRQLQYTSIFISSVLNSVPFAEDRKHIACICAALASPHTKLYAAATSMNQAGMRQVQGGKYLSKTQATAKLFMLEYEPGITLGDISNQPKVQKYHTLKEFYGLFKEFFEIVSVNDSNHNVQAVCSKPLKINTKTLRKALEFEFDLPYPDGSRMGLVDEAIEAFSMRLGIKL
jgi:hypothetical protein